MSEITEKVAYLRGLAEGANLGQETPVEKILTQMLEVMGEMAAQLEEMDAEQQELLDYVESIDEGVAELEEDFYDYDDDDDDPCMFCEGDCDACAFAEEEESEEE